jgi:hypothetical protein
MVPLPPYTYYCGRTVRLYSKGKSEIKKVSIEL